MLLFKLSYIKFFLYISVKELQATTIPVLSKYATMTVNVDQKDVSGKLQEHPEALPEFTIETHQQTPSDKYLTAVSGLLDLLEGDAVMADRGFIIGDLLEPLNITLNIPSRVEDPSGQLTEHGRVETCRIASVRVHVERAIGRIKNYHILHLIPNSMHSNVNQVFLLVHSLVTFNLHL